MNYFIEPKRGREDFNTSGEEQSNKKLKESIKSIASWIELNETKNKIETFTLYEVTNITIDIAIKIQAEQTMIENYINAKGVILEWLTSVTNGKNDKTLFVILDENFALQGMSLISIRNPFYNVLIETVKTTIDLIIEELNLNVTPKLRQAIATDFIKIRISTERSNDKFKNAMASTLRYLSINEATLLTEKLSNLVINFNSPIYAVENSSAKILTFWLNYFKIKATDFLQYTVSSIFLYYKKLIEGDVLAKALGLNESENAVYSLMGFEKPIISTLSNSTHYWYSLNVEANPTVFPFPQRGIYSIDIVLQSNSLIIAHSWVTDNMEGQLYEHKLFYVRDRTDKIIEWIMKDILLECKTSIEMIEDKKTAIEFSTLAHTYYQKYKQQKESLELLLIYDGTKFSGFCLFSTTYNFKVDYDNYLVSLFIKGTSDYIESTNRIAIFDLINEIKKNQKKYLGVVRPWQFHETFELFQKWTTSNQEMIMIIQDYVNKNAKLVSTINPSEIYKILASRFLQSSWGNDKIEKSNTYINLVMICPSSFDNRIKIETLRNIFIFLQDDLLNISSKRHSKAAYISIPASKIEKNNKLLKEYGFNPLFNLEILDQYDQIMISPNLFIKKLNFQ
jgi:hypothetical protein